MGRLNLVLRPNPAPITALFLVLSLGFCLSILTSATFRQARTDLVAHALPFHMAMTERYQLIEEARNRGDSSLSVPALRIQPPVTTFFDDLKENQLAFQNACFARFMGLEQITLHP